MQLEKLKLKVDQERYYTNQLANTIGPLVSNPAMQLLAFVVVIEILQRVKFDFGTYQTIPTLNGPQTIKIPNYSALITPQLGTILEGGALLTGLISSLGKSDVIEKLTKAGTDTAKAAGPVISSVLPLLMAAGAAA